MSLLLNNNLNTLRYIRHNYLNLIVFNIYYGETLMRNFYSYSHANCTKAKSPLEIPESEIATCRNSINSQHSRSRHISQWETKSHRNRLNQFSYAPKVCQISTYKTQTTTNLPLNILRYQLSDRQAKQNHLNNIRQNLNRRLQVSRAQRNEKLINIVQEEYQQLESSS